VRGSGDGDCEVGVVVSDWEGEQALGGGVDHALYMLCGDKLQPGHIDVLVGFVDVHKFVERGMHGSIRKIL
jgi:hypothetical protein